jgi:hypothetical protein
MTNTDESKFHEGYFAGDYASAYQTEDIYAALATLPHGRSYRLGFIAGFYATFEAHEIWYSDDDELHAALATAIELGLRDGDEG